jgi:tripartite-type tricarboxylate transporter receptor subunit TctC
MLQKLLGVAAAITAISTALPASAADYPTRPITLVLGFAPGGPSDVVARIVMKKMEQILGQPIVIENRPGAGGNTAAEAVARSTPDGYTLAFATNGMMATNISLYKKIGYDPVKDFAPITIFGSQANILYVHPSVKANSLAELVALAKANPGKLNFASGGHGTAGHLAGELFKTEAKVDIQHVAYKGTGPALQDVLAGHVQMAFSAAAPIVPHIQTGAVRPLAVTSLKRTAALPDVPAFAELGYPGFEAITWHSMVGPAATPKEVIATLHRAAMTALADADVRKQLGNLGVDVVGNTPEEFAAYVKAEIPKWASIIKASGATLD